MNDKVEGYLASALQRLEKAAEEIRQQKVNFQKQNSLQVLIEIVKEQIQNEDTRPPAR